MASSYINKKEAEEVEREFIKWLETWARGNLKSNRRGNDILKEWDKEHGHITPENAHSYLLAGYRADQVKQGTKADREFNSRVFKYVVTYTRKIFEHFDDQKRLRRMRMLNHYCRTFYKAVDMLTANAWANTSARYENPAEWALNPSGVAKPYSRDEVDRALMELKQEEEDIRIRMKKDLKAIKSKNNGKE